MNLSDVDLSDPDVFQQGRHHDAFEVLRRDDPVHWQPEPGGGGFWCITRHTDIVAVNRDAAAFSSGRGFTLMDPPEGIEGDSQRELLPGMDAPRHTRYRRVVNRGFTPRILALVEAHLAAKATAIVDHVIESGHAEFVTDIAAELPLQAIAELMGVPQEDRHRIFEWSNSLIGLDDPEYQGSRDHGYTAAAEMFIYSDGLRRQRLADPRDDIVTTLVNAEVEGERLTDDEFGMFFLLLAVAGNETTRNAISHGMKALVDHPAQYAALAADPGRTRMERAVEEILRWATPVLYFRRTAEADIDIGGTLIRSGDKVALWYISGNRDEAVFPEPFRFDIDRYPSEQIAFGGGGPHFCLGANLARMEMRLIFTELVTRIADMTLDGEVEMLRSNFIGGIKRMPVRWTPGSRATPTSG
jgi:cholest-4-en-3-one 26-monooxygenase